MSVSTYRMSKKNALSELPLASDDWCGGRELTIGSQFMAILKVRFLWHPAEREISLFHCHHVQVSAPGLCEKNSLLHFFFQWEGMAIFWSQSWKAEGGKTSFENCLKWVVGLLWDQIQNNALLTRLFQTYYMKSSGSLESNYLRQKVVHSSGQFHIMAMVYLWQCGVYFSPGWLRVHKLFGDPDLGS